MKLSKFIVELCTLSGLSEQDFCKKLDINIEQFSEIKNGTAQSGPGITIFIKAISASLFSAQKPSVDLGEIQNELTQARAIIVTVGESSHLAEHHQVSLSVAAAIVDKARQRTT